ncbi:hAT family C-terminal dimerization region [Phytophthora infestans]|uniref:HAT family C-terminal dimerization region n=1 Tax=Phytophthora infestans TaxID=4787 RepID=A0A8S9UP64_PHYIN|nr:hAT family C-terminal dimerization region [Phytophthora infestans]
MHALINKRFDFVYGDAHGVAHILDPRFCGAQMDPDTRSNVKNLSRSGTGKTQRTWTLLKNGKLAVYDFWCSLNQFPILQDIAKRVFRCTAGSSVAERNFSAHGFVHSKLRNRLAPERVEKLVHIYFNARNIRDEDIEVYTELDDILRLIDEDEEDERNNQNEDFVYE